VSRIYDLFERACRVSCTANGKDPDEVIANPYGEGPRGAKCPRWKWVSEICGKEIRAIVRLVEEEYHYGASQEQ
jgi:hypothetical protein